MFLCVCVRLSTPTHPHSLPSLVDFSAFGINARHLGRVRAQVRTDEARQVLLTEIVARTIKNELRRHLRRTARSTSGDQHVTFIQAIVDYLSLAFGAGIDSQFYRQNPQALTRAILERYPSALTQEEQHSTCELMVTSPVSVANTLRRLWEMTGLRVSPLATSSLLSLSANLKLHDIVDEGIRLKHLEGARTASSRLCAPLTHLVPGSRVGE